MADTEETDAILRWIAGFDVDTDDFLADPATLLNGRVLAQVFNAVSTDQIGLGSLKPVASESDWVNALINMRSLQGRISDTLKAHKVAPAIDLPALTKRRDSNEMAKFLKFFLFYAVNAPQSEKAVAVIQSLDEPTCLRLQSVIEGFAAKPDAQPAAPRAVAPAAAPAASPASPLAGSQKLSELQAELSNLKEKATALAAAISRKNAELADLNQTAASESRLEDLKAAYTAAVAKRNELKSELDSSRQTVSEIASQVEELRRVQGNLDPEPQSAAALQARLDACKQKVVALVGPVENDDVRSYVRALDLPRRAEEIEKFRQSFDGFSKERSRKQAEAAALRGTLAEQNQRASSLMLKRIAQLNSEMDKSPIGEARKTCLKYRRIIQKLGAEIEQLEKSGGSVELGELQNQVQQMALRKACESDLLAKKLSFMQSTAEQCDIRLQRLKLHVEFQMHASRLKRWRNCFAPPADTPN